MRPINPYYQHFVRNKQISYFAESINTNKLYFIDDFLKENPKLFRLSKHESVYNCLSWFDEEEIIRPDFILIENPENVPQLVLINNSAKLLFIGYNSNHIVERFYPIFENRTKGINQLSLIHNFILFARVEALKEPIHPFNYK